MSLFKKPKYEKNTLMDRYTKLYGNEDDKHYTLEKILSLDCLINIIYSDRNNGKSYTVGKLFLIAAYYFDMEFMYVRRQDTDISRTAVRQWFEGLPIEKYTNGEYSGIDYYGEEIFFTYIDEKGNIKKGKRIGHAAALSTSMQHLKSRQYPKVEFLVLEEFITDQLYLNNEMKLFLNLLSTVARSRKIKVFLLGNTDSPHCPYVEYYGIKKFDLMRPGDIERYEFKRIDKRTGKEVITPIAVERCPLLEGQDDDGLSLYAGDYADAIQGDKWAIEVTEMPTMEYDKENHKILYEVVMEESSEKFVAQLIFDKTTNGLFMFVYPYNGRRHIKRHITTEFSTDPWYSQRFKDEIPAEATMKKLMNDSKICYCNNKTGNLFQQVIIRERKGGF